MTGRDWFDELSVHLATDLSRRGIFRVSRGLAAAAALATAGESSAGKKRKKKHGNGRKPKPKPQPQANQSCSQGECGRQWAGNQAEIDYCEFICRQCDGNDLRDFCVIDAPDPVVMDKVAICCAAPAACCDSACADLMRSKLHCGRCNNECPMDADCVDGECKAICGGGGVVCPLSPYYCCVPPNGCCNGVCMDLSNPSMQCGE